MTIVNVNAGSCGFITEVRVQKIDSYRVNVRVISQCEMITNWGSELGTIFWKENLRSIRDSYVFECAFDHIRHIACPVPIALLKAIEVEVGIETPADVSISFTEVEAE